jgi:hypothetical protein
VIYNSLNSSTPNDETDAGAVTNNVFEVCEIPSYDSAQTFLVT